MEFVRRWFSSTEYPNAQADNQSTLTDHIPGAFPHESVNDNEGSQINDGNSSADQNREPRIFKYLSVLMEKLYRIPLYIVYVSLRLVIFILMLLRPFLRNASYYRRFMQNAEQDHRIQLSILLDKLEQEAGFDINELSADSDNNSLVSSQTPRYSFGSLYGLEHGNLVADHMQNSYTSILNSCFEQAKFGIIYLHDPLRDDSMSYVTNILCSEHFVNLVKEHELLLWFGDVTRSSEALQVANAMKTCHFPFLGVISSKPGHRIEIVGSLSGTYKADMIKYLKDLLIRHKADILELREQQQSIESSRNMREQQNQSFEESVRIDQERELSRASQVSDTATNGRSKKLWLIWRKSRLKPEPNEGTDYTRLAIRIPGHQRIIRKFDASLHIEEIYAFVDLYQNGYMDRNITDISAGPPSNYTHRYTFSLSSPSPREELDQEQIIAETASIYPNGNIVVEPVREE